MRKRAKTIGLVVLLIVLGAGHANAQFAVSDIVTELGISKETVETVKNGLTSLRELQTTAQQLEWLTSLTTNLVHDPNLGAIMQIAGFLGLDSDIPLNLYAVQSLISGYGGSASFSGLMGKLSTLSGVVNSSYLNDNLYTCHSTSFACAQSNANMAGYAGSKGMVSTMVQSLQNHLTVLKGLQTRLGTSGNLKDTADAQAEVATQEAWVNSQTAQIQAVSAMSDVQSKISAEQTRQSWFRDLDTWNDSVK